MSTPYPSLGARRPLESTPGREASGWNDRRQACGPRPRAAALPADEPRRAGLRRWASAALPLALALAWPQLAPAADAAHGAPADAGHSAKPAADAHAAKPASSGGKVEAAAKPVDKASPVEDAAPKSVASTAAQPRAAGGAQDPLDVLRDLLAERLGATKAQAPAGVRAAHVVQVASRATGEFRVTPASTRTASSRSKSARDSSHGKDGGHGSTGSHGEAHWDYSGANGPDQWASLKPEFSACASGKRQSPIDIRDGFALDLEPVTFDYRPSGFTVVNNGHTLQANLSTGNRIEVAGRYYELVQFHFHHPAEERVNGRSFDMVAHLVHKDAEGRLAVVAVLMDRGAPQTVVQQVWNNLPLENQMPVQARTALDPSELLPADRRYYTYMGSLTTPPCTEGVRWIVMKQPVGVSMEQIALFSRLYPMNARPIQAAWGRVIKQSN
jgi:carbonic anhydrase